MRKTEVMQTRNGVIYFPLEDRKREDWRVEIIQNATVVDVLLAVAAAVLLVRALVRRVRRRRYGGGRKRYRG